MHFLECKLLEDSGYECPGNSVHSTEGRGGLEILSEIQQSTLGDSRESQVLLQDTEISKMQKQISRICCLLEEFNVS